MESRYENDDNLDSMDASYESQESLDDAEIAAIVTESDQYRLMGENCISQFNKNHNYLFLVQALKCYEHALKLLKSLDLPSPYLECCIELSTSELSFFANPANKNISDSYLTALKENKVYQAEKQNRQSQGHPPLATSRMVYHDLRTKIEADDETDAQNSVRQG